MKTTSLRFSSDLGLTIYLHADSKVKLKKKKMKQEKIFRLLLNR